MSSLLEPQPEPVSLYAVAYQMLETGEVFRPRGIHNLETALSIVNDFNVRYKDLCCYFVTEVRLQTLSASALLQLVEQGLLTGKQAASCLQSYHVSPPRPVKNYQVAKHSPVN